MIESAEARYQQMLAAYGACDRYEDEGAVDGPLGRHWFKTEFERPTTFSFDFGGWQGDQRQVQYQLVHGPLSTCVWRARYPEDVQEYESLDQAVAALKGVTCGVVHRVPALLLPSLTGRTLRHLGSLRLAGSEMVGDRPCTIFEGGYPDKADCRETLWIGTAVPWLARAVTTILAPGLSGAFVCEYVARGV
jgi:hypothetical protein